MNSIMDSSHLILYVYGLIWMAVIAIIIHLIIKRLKSKNTDNSKNTKQLD
jgi:hypothetical protein